MTHRVQEQRPIAALVDGEARDAGSEPIEDDSSAVVDRRKELALDDVLIVALPPYA